MQRLYPVVFLSEKGCKFHHRKCRYLTVQLPAVDFPNVTLPCTVSTAVALTDPKIFVALQMYIPSSPMVTADITSTPSSLLFSGLFPCRSQTTVGGGLPALTKHLKITLSPLVAVRFVAGVMSISGGTFTKGQSESKGLIHRLKLLVNKRLRFRRKTFLQSQTKKVCVHF